MVLIKTTFPPMPTNVLGVEISSIEGTKVLEAAVQTNLCGLIDMLSLVAVRANEVFTGILQETKGTVARFDQLHTRVNALNSQLAKVDDFFQNTANETLCANPRSKLFHSKHSESSRMLTPQTRPAALQEVYDKCRPPPHLEKLDSLNDPPGTSCLKLYSDPEFFEAEWILEMDKQREAAKVKRKERKKKRAETALEKKSGAGAVKIEAKPVLRAKYDPHTGQRIDVVERGSSSSNLVSSNSSSNLVERAPSQTNMGQTTPRAVPPTPVERGTSNPNFSAPPTTSPRVKPPASGGSLTHAQARSAAAQPGANPSFSAAQPSSITPRGTPQTPGNPGFQRAVPQTPGNLPPPMQPTHSSPSHLPPSTPPHKNAPPPSSRAPPPLSSLPPSPHSAPPSPSIAPSPPPPPPSAPPPPPPPSAPPPPPAGGPSLSTALIAKGSALRPTDDAGKSKPVDSQSELLNQIKKGMNLKQTVQNETEKHEVVDNSVAAILARRIAIADSDDEDDGGESDEWSD